MTIKKYIHSNPYKVWLHLLYFVALIIFILKVTTQLAHADYSVNVCEKMIVSSSLDDLGNDVIEACNPSLNEINLSINSAKVIKSKTKIKPPKLQLEIGNDISGYESTYLIIDHYKDTCTESFSLCKSKCKQSLPETFQCSYSNFLVCDCK